MTSKFLKIVTVILALIALGMTVFGTYIVISYRLGSYHPVCDPATGCVPMTGVIAMYVTLTIGVCAFAVLSHFYSREAKKREDRNRDY